MSTPAAPAAPAPATAPAAESGAVPTPPAEQPGHKVFAGNLAYSTTDEGLKAFFSSVASDIISTQIIYRGPRSAGYGFVAFKTLEVAKKAAEDLNKKELDGRTVIVELAKPQEEKEKAKTEKKSKKRASKKAKDAADAAPTTEAAADKPAEGADATPKTKAKKKRNPRKSKKAKATTEGDAAAPATADGATEEKKKEKAKKVKTPKAPKVPRPAGEAPAGEPSKTMLFVANLGFTIDDAALGELFTSAGINVVSARVVRRRWGTPRRSKGYGFVDVGSEDQQKKAIDVLQGKDVGGREIAVKIAVDAQIKEDDDAPAAPAPAATAPAATPAATTA